MKLIKFKFREINIGYITLFILAFSILINLIILFYAKNCTK